MTRGASRPRRWSASADRAREDLLRPCPYLGYDHDRVGVHCLAREAFGVAETFFRRAIWLNPHEPRFVLHLGLALFRQKRFREALEALEDIDPEWADFGKVRELRATVLASARDSAGGGK